MGCKNNDSQLPFPTDSSLTLHHNSRVCSPCTLHPPTHTHRVRLSLTTVTLFCHPREASHWSIESLRELPPGAALSCLACFPSGSLGGTYHCSTNSTVGHVVLIVCFVFGCLRMSYVAQAGLRLTS